MLGLCGIIPAVYIIYQSNSWIDYLLVLVCASVFEMIYQYLRGHLQHASVQSVRLDKLKPGDLLENGLRLSSGPIGLYSQSLLLIFHIGSKVHTKSSQTLRGYNAA